MKTRNTILCLLFAMAIAVAAAWNFSRNQDEVTLSDLALENVEALANGEGGSVTCCPDPGDTCQVGGTFVPNYDEC